MWIPTFRLLTQLSVEAVFLIVGAVGGVLYVFGTPPFQVPDEPHHFFRAFQVAQGGILAEKRGDTTGGVVPTALVRIADRFTEGVIYHPERKLSPHLLTSTLLTPWNKADTTFANFPNTALYSPVPYIPSVLVTAIGYQTGVPPLIVFYACRLANLVVGLLLIAFAIRFVPVYKWVLFVTCLTPMFMYQLASVSADAMTNSLGVLLTALFLRYSLVTEQRVTTGGLAMFFTVALLFALCKTGYFTLALLFFLIPSGKFPTWRWWMASGLGLVLLSWVVSLTWAGLIQGLFSPYLKMGVSPEDAIRFIQLNPLRFSGMVLDNLFRYGLFYTGSYIGYLGWLDVKLPEVFVTIYALVILGVCLTSGHCRMHFDLSRKGLLAGVFLLSVLLIITSQYLIWTPVNSRIIDAAQGRYFIPIAPTLFLLIFNRKYPADKFDALHRNVLPTFVFLSLLFSLGFVIHRYYL